MSQSKWQRLTIITPLLVVITDFVVIVVLAVASLKGLLKPSSKPANK